jgi:hypothetical protein
MTPRWKDLLRTPLRLRGSQDAQRYALIPSGLTLRPLYVPTHSSGDRRSRNQWRIALMERDNLNLPRLASTLTKTLNAEGLGLKAYPA